jgi:hypothetical protein
MAGHPDCWRMNGLKTSPALPDRGSRYAVKTPTAPEAVFFLSTNHRLKSMPRSAPQAVFRNVRLPPPSTDCNQANQVDAISQVRRCRAALGVGDVAFLDGDLYAVLAGGGCSHGNTAFPNAVIKVNVKILRLCPCHVADPLTPSTVL